MLQIHLVAVKKYLDEDQIEAIRQHFELAKKMGLVHPDDKWAYAWSIDENSDYIAGDVSMDNFSMYGFLEKIGAPMDRVSWDKYAFDIDNPDIDENKKADTSEESIDWRSILHDM